MTALRYCLRLSVRLLGKAPIHGLESEPAISVGPVLVTVKQRSPYLVLLADGFSSEAEAEAFLPKLKGGLWNIALAHNIAFTPYFERREITRPEDPYAAARNIAKSFGQQVEEPVKPLHGLTEDEGYTIYRTDENIRFLGFDGGTASVSTGWDSVSKTLAAGIENVRPLAGVSESALATAIDLYLASHYETSIRAKLLTLMMALEVLAPATEKHKVAVTLLTDFKTRVDAQLAVELDEDARDALEALQKEIEFRKETAIRRRIRRLVLDNVALDEGDRRALAKKVVDAYDLRGAVVHTGTVDQRELGVANDTALNVVKLLLRRFLGLDVVPVK
jgi:hypothetical protein